MENKKESYLLLDGRRTGFSPVSDKNSMYIPILDGSQVKLNPNYYYKLTWASKTHGHEAKKMYILTVEAEADGVVKRLKLTRQSKDFHGLMTISATLTTSNKSLAALQEERTELEGMYNRAISVYGPSAEKKSIGKLSDEVNELLKKTRFKS